MHGLRQERMQKAKNRLIIRSADIPKVLRQGRHVVLVTRPQLLRLASGKWQG